MENTGLKNMKDAWMGVVGYPLTHSLSQKFHEENLKRKNLPYSFKVLEWPENDFEQKVRDLKGNANLIGFSVTMPYKAKIISYLDECEEFAQKVQSVNCVKVKDGKWMGYNTDAPGFLHHLKLWNPAPPRDVTIVVMGIGATGRTLSYALAESGFKNFVLMNRSLLFAQKWAIELKKYFSNMQVQVENWGDPSAFGLGMTDVFILNATPIGMKGEAFQWLNLSTLQNPVWLFDVTYNPPETLLVRQCKSKCFYTMNGLPMFQKQAELAFQLWTS